MNEVLVAPGQRRRSRGEPHVRVTAASIRSTRRRSSRWRGEHASELVVVGPEAPLAAGVADALRGRRDRGLRADRGGRADRDLEGVLPRGRRGGGRPDGPGAGVRGGRGRGGARLRARARRRRPRRRAEGGRPRRGQGRDRRRVGRAGDRARAVVPRRPPRPTARRSSSRSGSRAARRASSRSATGRGPWRCPPRATTSGCATATRARTPAAWAPTRRCRTSTTTPSSAVLETVHRPILAEMAAPRHPVPRLPLRRPDAHRRRPGPARVQRPARRSRGPGDPAAARRRARAVAAGRRARPAPGRRAGARSPSSRTRRSGSSWRRRATRRPAPRRPDRRARRRPRHAARSCSTPGRSGARRRLRHQRRAGAHGRRARARPAAAREARRARPRTRSRWDGLQRRRDIARATVAAAGRERRRDPALHAARDGRHLDRARPASSTCSRSSSRSAAPRPRRGLVPPEALAAIEARARGRRRPDRGARADHRPRRHRVRRRRSPRPSGPRAATSTSA